MNPYHQIDYEESENHAPGFQGSILKAPLVARTQKMVKSPNYFDIKGQIKIHKTKRFQKMKICFDFSKKIA